MSEPKPKYWPRMVPKDHPAAQKREKKSGKPLPLPTPKKGGEK